MLLAHLAAFLLLSPFASEQTTAVPDVQIDVTTTGDMAAKTSSDLEPDASTLETLDKTTSTSPEPTKVKDDDNPAQSGAKEPPSPQPPSSKPIAAGPAAAEAAVGREVTALAPPEPAPPLPNVVAEDSPALVATPPQQVVADIAKPPVAKPPVAKPPVAKPPVAMQPVDKPVDVAQLEEKREARRRAREKAAEERREAEEEERRDAERERREEARERASLDALRSARRQAYARQRAARSAVGASGQRAAALGGASAAPRMSMQSYEALVAAEINRHRFYPADARAEGITGKVDVTFLVGPSGSITSYAITRSSGYSSLDRAARQIIRSSHPPPPPGGGFYRSSGPISFNSN